MAGIARQAPRRLILSQDTQAFGDFGFGQPFDLPVLVLLENIVDPLQSYQLDGAGAVLADRAEQRECVAGRYMKPLSPAGQDGFVVGKQSPEPGLDPGVLMFGDHERHREGKRISRIHGAPAVVIDECQSASPVAPNLAHDLAIGNDDKKLGHGRSCLAAFTTASISTASMS